VCVTGKVNSEIVWSQPILILQNRYPSAMINKWDGNLLIDQDNNSILAAKIAAGKKESDNSFTGVMLGNFGGADSETQFDLSTGLFGFHKGSQSFAFKDDGTAFIGKDGVGRIEFDGNEGII